MDSIFEIICVKGLMAVNLDESKGLIDHSLIIPAVDSAISVSRVGSDAQFKNVRRLVRTIKDELTNYRRWLESAHIADEEEETEDIQLLRLKGRSIECMYFQD